MAALPRALVGVLMGVLAGALVGALPGAWVPEARAQAASAPAAALPASAAALPVELFFRHPDLQAARLSPSGRWLAATIGLPDGRFGLAVLDMQGSEPPAVLVHLRDADVRNFQWVNERWLVYDVVDLERGSGDPRHAPGLFSVARDGSETRLLVKLRREFISGGTRIGDRSLPYNHRLLHVPAGEGDEVIVGEMRFGSARELQMLLPKRLNVVTGRVRSIAHGMPDGVTAWLFDSAGRPRLATVRREGRMVVHWRVNPEDTASSAWREIANVDALQPPWTPLAVDAQGQLYVTASEGQAGERVLKRYDFAAGRPETEALVVTPGFDFDGGVITEASGGRLLGVRADTDAETTVWLEPRLKAIQEEVDRRLPGRVNRLSCRQCDTPEITVLVQSWSDREPGQVWLWQGEAAAPRRWQPVGQRRKGVDARQMATLSFTRYAARDGLSIPLWITHPATAAGAAAAGPRPAVVLVHGGPWVRGGRWAWDGMAQFLASRGYVVLAPEFRGSTGYGAVHFRAGWKQWGRAMQDDLADAVRWAAARGLVDAKRVCIAGASYGGYATLMGLVRNDDTFRCGAAWVAVAEPALLFNSDWSSDVSDEARLHTLPAMLADPVAEAGLLRDISPVVQAARLQAPLLLAYGELDRRVPLEHGRRLQAALQAAGREPEYVVYPGEGHQWQRAEHRIDFARRLERFLAQNLRPTASSPSSASAASAASAASSAPSATPP